MGYDAYRVFENLGAYNRRANRELYESAGSLTDQVRKRDTGGWFGSIHDILNHILVCDINWLKRFSPLAPESPVLSDPRLSPPGLSWERHLHEEFDEMRDTRSGLDELIIAWFREFDPDRYDERFVYADSKGTERPAVAGEAFEFLFLHQTHHRGQVGQILDYLGQPNNIADNDAYLEHVGMSDITAR
jgi:uncharacterized damage-inducible protein DinB